jgi:predicted polyphosphate/ATP-dependent NAD kinase
LDDEVPLNIHELGEDGPREHFPAGFFRDRQGARLLAKVSEGRLKIKTERVVDLGGDARETE